MEHAYPKNKGDEGMIIETDIGVKNDIIIVKYVFSFYTNNTLSGLMVLFMKDKMRAYNMQV